MVLNSKAKPRRHAPASADQRRVAARVARELAERLHRLADSVEGLEDGAAEIEAVHRARNSFRQVLWKPDPYARLLVLESLLRAERVCELARQPLANVVLNNDCLPVVVAAEILRGNLLPGQHLSGEPQIWISLLDAWRIGPGAPSKKRGHSKWDRLAALLNEHLEGVSAGGSATLRSQWMQWLKGSETLRAGQVLPSRRKK